ncbi:prepilin peptidase [Tateyamaria armeniaca]|uniref:Prepilin peptidase n=1 Tax=Tateyamaria armeniaca TaxID=2518930 RepID=A0ABW8UTS0_9RHOB
MAGALKSVGIIIWPASAVLGLMLAWICVVDFQRFEIPDAASLGLLIVGLVFSLTSPLVTPWLALVGAAVAYLAFAALGAVFFQITGQDGLGLGDAKLLGAAGAWLGPWDLPLLVAVASFGALAFAALTRQRRIAFGPWLAGAFWVVWMVRISA